MSHRSWQWLLIGLVFFANYGVADVLDDAYQKFNANQFEQAVKQFKSYNQGHPQDFDQLYNTGVALYKQGQFAEAQQYFDKALQSHDPRLKAKAAYNKGMALIGQKKLPEAESSLQEALSYDNQNKAISDNLAWVKEAKNRNEPPQPDQSASKDSQDQQQKDAEQKPGQQQENQQGNQETGTEGKQQEGSEAKSADTKNSASKAPENQQQKSPTKSQAGQSADAAQEKPPQAGPSAEQLAKAKDSPLPQGSEGVVPDKNAASSGKAASQTLSLPDLKQQEAEKLLRSVEDRLGRYTLTPEQADVEGKSKNGKAW